MIWVSKNFQSVFTFRLGLVLTQVPKITPRKWCRKIPCPMLDGEKDRPGWPDGFFRIFPGLQAVGLQGFEASLSWWWSSLSSPTWSWISSLSSPFLLTSFADGFRSFSKKDQVKLFGGSLGSLLTKDSSSMEHLAGHVENGQRDVKVKSSKWPKLGRKIGQPPPHTTLTAFFKLCSEDDFDLTQSKTHGKSPGRYGKVVSQTKCLLGRMFTVHLSNRECYFLRIFLITKGTQRVLMIYKLLPFLFKNNLSTHKQHKS